MNARPTVRNEIRFILNGEEMILSAVAPDETLLDFLRLRTKYDRVCWNLKPVVLAHEILVRRGMEGPARVWRRARFLTTAPPTLRETTRP